MNIDGLHQKAGSDDVLEIHGTMPNVVLYGDPAPHYRTAKIKVKTLPYKQAVLLVIGISFTTSISEELVKLARQKGAKIIMIDDNAETRVRSTLKNLFKVTQIAD